MFCHMFWHTFWHAVLAFYLTFFSGILSGIYSDIIFWHSICYIFGDSLWLRPGREHSDPALAVEVRRGTLWSGACGGCPAGNTLIRSLRWMSGGEHCDLEPAVEVRWRKEEEGGGQADVKSNNPHLTGGEKKSFRACLYQDACFYVARDPLQPSVDPSATYFLTGSNWKILKDTLYIHLELYVCNMCIYTSMYGTHIHTLFIHICYCLKPPYPHICTAGTRMFPGDLRSVGHSHWHLAVAALQRRAGVAEGGAVAGTRMAHGADGVELEDRGDF